jgi:hypothetical protein
VTGGVSSQADINLWETALSSVQNFHWLSVTIIPQLNRDSSRTPQRDCEPAPLFQTVGAVSVRADGAVAFAPKVVDATRAVLSRSLLPVKRLATDLTFSTLQPTSLEIRCNVDDRGAIS